MVHVDCACRLEEVNLTRRDGLAKIVGTIACVGGATIITLYKGPAINELWQRSLNLEDAAHLSANKAENWTLGCLYMIGNCLAWSGWIVIQVIFSSISFIHLHSIHP